MYAVDVRPARTSGVCLYGFKKMCLQFDEMENYVMFSAKVDGQKFDSFPGMLINSWFNDLAILKQIYLYIYLFSSVRNTCDQIVDSNAR